MDEAWGRRWLPCTRVRTTVLPPDTRAEGGRTHWGEAEGHVRGIAWYRNPAGKCARAPPGRRVARVACRGVEVALLVAGEHTVVLHAPLHVHEPLPVEPRWGVLGVALLVYAGLVGGEVPAVHRIRQFIPEDESEVSCRVARVLVNEVAHRRRRHAHDADVSRCPGWDVPLLNRAC